MRLLGSEEVCITLWVDPRRPFTLGLVELADLLEHSLRDLGLTVIHRTNGFEDGIPNILLGYHRLPGPARPRPFPLILVQLEQLSDREGWFTEDRLAILKDADAVWDYAETNVRFLAGRGVSAVHLPIGYHRALDRIAREDDEPIDVLFYGSVNERQKRILDELAGRCRLHHLFGVYGDERDRIIARSKMVLNLHFYELQLFESVRVSYLLNNRRLVVSESSPECPYEGFPTMVAYEHLVDTCIDLLSDDARRRVQADADHERVIRLPMVDLVRRAVAETSR